MATTPNDPTTALPGRPPVVDLAAWQTARDELLVREKAHTRRATPSPRLAAGYRWWIRRDRRVVGPDGPVPFLDLFEGRTSRGLQAHWYDGAPHQGRCEGCTTTAWHMKDAVYLNARGVSSAVLTTGRPRRGGLLRRVHGYPQPWYSVRDVDAPVGGSMGSLTASCATATARSSPTQRRAVATSRSTGRWPARHDALRPVVA